MSHVRAAALLCACALVVNAAAEPALGPPRRSTKKESRVVKDKIIAVKKMHVTYIYPFSLWPLPRFSNTDRGDSEQKHQYKRSSQIYQIRENKR
ncbi:unnamed protein product [Parnassius apollo]|uniref:(apollo) hypothetical protein n=1 Tax=Parnassius apollo TaxID=110799 RepID=A0A8S3W408_PARAO|nr:unnamed protein product [Parnassius apollo]